MRSANTSSGAGRRRFQYALPAADIPREIVTASGTHTHGDELRPDDRIPQIAARGTSVTAAVAITICGKYRVVPELELKGSLDAIEPSEIAGRPLEGGTVARSAVRRKGGKYQRRSVVVRVPHSRLASLALCRGSVCYFCCTFRRVTPPPRPRMLRRLSARASSAKPIPLCRVRITALLSFAWGCTLRVRMTAMSDDEWMRYSPGLVLDKLILLSKEARALGFEGEDGEGYSIIEPRHSQDRLFHLRVGDHTYTGESLPSLVDEALADILRLQ